jgi:uncharacterized protein YuzE
MKATYDADVDAISFRLSKSRIVDSEMIQPGVIVDYDKNDRIVGIEILSFCERFDIFQLAGDRSKTAQLKVRPRPFKNSGSRKTARPKSSLPRSR